MDPKEWRESMLKVAAVEARLHKPRAIGEKLIRFAEMRRAFLPRLKATRARYHQERFDYLADLQERLRKVAEFTQGRST